MDDVYIAANYEALKVLFEERRFKTEMGDCPFHAVDEETGEVVSRSKRAFTVAFEDWISHGKKFLKAWYADGTKRSYERVEYGCVKAEDRKSYVYYAFPELRHVKLESSSSPEQKQANVDYFLDYVMLLVEDNPAYVEWMVMWLADILESPHHKENIVVILRGEHDAGKTFLSKLMAQMLGTSLVHRVISKRNKKDKRHKQDKQRLFIEFEGEVAYKRRTVATEREILTTNTGCRIVPSDGIYAAFDVSSRRVGDTAYWNEHHGMLKDPCYIKDIAEYLISNTGPYALRENRPLTDYYRSLL